ncbi:putative protein misato-like 1 [Penaeus vannamei]|uniref:Protein misato n=1 Tax=Penaeus vannamei TaxID=6689 RepID=A0A3R7SPM2_PENVA|nr:protein misato homolog 1-like [Penaeus vannamei]ROT69703.1 putative protein misato-like 1 [Penaeus vannamei]
MAKSARELITLQIGHYANFIGTHWWNLQEASFVYDDSSTTDINHDFLFREGITPQKQETYTPRLLSIDIKGNLGSLPVDGSLYSPQRNDLSVNEASWHGRVELIKQLPEEKNEYLMDLEIEDSRYFTQRDEDKDICMDDVTNEHGAKSSSLPASQKIYDLSKSVRVWSDFLRPHLHPNSLYLLDEMLLQSGRAVVEGSQSNYGFLAGASVYQREDVEDGITDRIRLLAESCGSLQGYQILTDVHNAMGGVSQGILQHLEDEYSTKDFITFGITPPHLNPQTPQAKALIQATIAQSYSELSSLSGVFVPLNLRSHCLDLQAPVTKWPHLNIEENNQYLSSSIIAAFLDTMSLIYRSRTSPLPVAHIVDVLTFGGRKIAGGSLALPYGLGVDDYLFDWVKGHKPPLMSVSSGCDISVDPVSEVQVIRGVQSSRLVSSDTRLPPGVRYASAAQLYQSFLEESETPPSLRFITSVRDPLKVGTPFPSIFSEKLSEDGLLVPSTSSFSATSVKSTPCGAGLHQGGSIGTLLEQLLESAQNLNVMKVPQLIDEGMDKEGWSSVLEELKKLKLNYCHNNEEMESSDDD